MGTFLFNFKAQFVPLVESGEKTHTVRQVRKDKRRPVPGDVAKCYQGLRTSKARLLLTSPVTKCQAVRLHIDEGFIVIDGSKLTQAEALAFSRADGFSSTREMLDWFSRQYQTNEFEGFCTHWAVPQKGLDHVLP